MDFNGYWNGDMDLSLRILIRPRQPGHMVWQLSTTLNNANAERCCADWQRTASNIPLLHVLPCHCFSSLRKVPPQLCLITPLLSHSFPSLVNTNSLKLCLWLLPPPLHLHLRQPRLIPHRYYLTSMPNHYYDSSEDSPVAPTTPSISSVTNQEFPHNIISSQTSFKQAIIMKLERFTARLRALECDEDSQPISLTDLSRMLDRALSFTPSHVAAVLPVHQRVPPNSRSWNETKTMMPSIKTRRKRVGDPAYGAGERSGKRARELKQL